MSGRVEGDDADVVFQVFQQLVELLLAAAAVGEDLHLVGSAPRRPRLDVPEVHVLLLWRREERRGREEDGGEGDLKCGRGGNPSAHLEEPESFDQTADLVLQREDHRRLPSSLGCLPVSRLVDGTEGRTSGLQGTTHRQQAAIIANTSINPCKTTKQPQQ